MVVDLRNVCFCQKKWMSLKKHVPEIWSGIYIKILLTLRNRNTPWGLHDFVPVCYCLWLKIPVQSVPILTPQNNWHLRIYWHRGYKASKVCADLRGKWFETHGEKCLDRFSIPRWWKLTIFDAKRNMARFANNDCCWHILLTSTNPQEMSCWNQLRGPVSHRFSSWIAVKFATAATNSCNQQLQPTAWQLRPISRHIASMKDQDGSGTSAYTGCKKNVVIYRSTKSPLEQCHDERPS